MKAGNLHSARLHRGGRRDIKGIAAILRGLCIFFALLFLTPALLACSSGTEDIIVLEDKSGGKQNGKSNGNSDRSDGKSSAATDGHHYILNKQSMKMHLPSCSTVLRIVEGNREERFDSYDALLEEGYTPCVFCLKTPPEKEKEEPGFLGNKRLRQSYCFDLQNRSHVQENSYRKLCSRRRGFCDNDR